MKTESLVIECSEPMVQVLDDLVKSGLFGPSRETAAQRLLEQKIFDMSMLMIKKRAE